MEHLLHAIYIISLYWIQSGIMVRSGASGPQCIVVTALRKDRLRKSAITAYECDDLGLEPTSCTPQHLGVLSKIEIDCPKLFKTATFPYRDEHPLNHFCRAFSCSIVAPDRCLVGNIRNMLDALFVSLTASYRQVQHNALFAQALASNALPEEKNVFNVPSNKLNTTTHLSYLFRGSKCGYWIRANLTQGL